MTPAATASDVALARHLAQQAAALLMDLRRRGGSGVSLGAQADHDANRLILAGLAAERPDDAILSEESPDDTARLAARRVWIVDPLDGTREYAEGRDDFAVHIGLAIDGVAVAGAVALPARNELYDSAAPPTLSPLHPRLRLVASRSRCPQCVTELAKELDADLVTMGSAGAKTMAVLRGEADAYLHEGGQHQWDNCAPVAIARAAGLHTSRIDGAPLVYNRTDTLIPDLLICHSEQAGRILDAWNIAK